MKKILCILPLLFASSANAALLDFEDLPESELHQLGTMQTQAYIDNPYKEFEFSSPVSWVDATSGATNFGTTSGNFAILNISPDLVTINRADDYRFRFGGFSAKAWNSFTGPVEEPVSATGIMRGFFEGGLVWTQTLELNNNYKSYAAQQLVIDRLEIGMSGGSFLIDDITMNVPTPTAFWLMATGLIGLLGTRKK